jgi:hypothetical protein
MEKSCTIMNRLNSETGFNIWYLSNGNTGHCRIEERYLSGGQCSFWALCWPATS